MEEIADPGFREDEFGLGRIFFDLFAQEVDIDIDDIGFGIEVYIPDVDGDVYS